MKKLLLLVALVGCYSAHAQKIKVTPPRKDWRKTVTPQQAADTLEALEAIYQRNRERYNIANALANRAEERANDSIYRLRAAQKKEETEKPLPK